MLLSGSPASLRRLSSVAQAMWEMVERTDDHPATGSATYCSAVTLRQASRTLVLAQRSDANNATTSSCMRISPGVAQGHCRYGRTDETAENKEFSPLPGKCRIQWNQWKKEPICPVPVLTRFDV